MARMMKLMVDYHCFPIWEFSDHIDGELIDNVDPGDLPLTDALKSDLNNWSAVYDRTLNHEYPPDSGFANSAEEKVFEAEGRRLWRELQSQLGTNYTIAYYSNRERRLLE